MKKIVIAFEHEYFPKACVDFAISLHAAAPVFLSAVQLSAERKADYWNYAGALGKAFRPQLKRQVTAAMRHNLEQFTVTCQSNHISFSIDEDTSEFAVEAVARETRFADLLLIAKDHFFKNDGEIMTEYLEQVLVNAECPLILLPDDFTKPGEIIFAFDGSADASFAMKQCIYLLDEFHSLPASVLTLSHKNSLFQPELIGNYLKARFNHFSECRQTTEENGWLKRVTEKNKPLIVCGAYGRSGLSYLFHKSFADHFLSNKQVALFIAHRRTHGR